jgi:hypothetical protein
VTSKRGGRRCLPYAFTEQGVAMLSSVLNSDIAIQVNIAIMRVFVALRKNESGFSIFMDKIIEIKNNQDLQQQEIKNIYILIDELLTPFIKRDKIGFTTKEN